MGRQMLEDRFGAFIARRALEEATAPEPGAAVRVARWWKSKVAVKSRWKSPRWGPDNPHPGYRLVPSPGSPYGDRLVRREG